MRPSNFFIFILFSFLSVDSSSQAISSNYCDSSTLTRDEYEKCKIDSIWTNDLTLKINYIVALKTKILTKFRPLRKGLNIPSNLRENVIRLKHLYDSILSYKSFIIVNKMDKKQLYVQPKAYLSSALSFQLFNFYPDIYAILLNDIHLQLIPKTRQKDLERNKILFDRLIKNIPNKLFDLLVQLTDQMQSDKSKIAKQSTFDIFQGSIHEGYRTKCNVVDFLLWTTE